MCCQTMDFFFHNKCMNCDLKRKKEKNKFNTVDHNDFDKGIRLVYSLVQANICAKSKGQ